MNPDKLSYLTKRDPLRTHEDQQSLHNSFTNLAAQISRIPTNKQKIGSENDLFVDSEEFDDEEFGYFLNFFFVLLKNEGVVIKFTNKIFLFVNSILKIVFFNLKLISSGLSE